MYSVNGKTFDSYMKAIAEAQSQNTNVIETKTGLTRWEPLRPVSDKRMNRYLGQKSAYEVQECHKASKAK